MPINISRSSLFKSHWPVILVIVLTLLVYGRCLGNSFVWDDNYLIVNNDFVHSFDNLPLLFSRDYLTSLAELDLVGWIPVGSGELSYRPVCTFSFFVDYFLWGLNPAGFHFTNLILHCLNGMLLYFLIWLIVQNRFTAALTALVFSLHPVNSEVVNVINFREDILVLFFWLIALIIHATLNRRNGWRRKWLMLAAVSCYGLSVFSKEMGIMLPAILLLYDHCFISKEERKNNFFLNINRGYYLAYMGIAVLFLWLWFFPMARPTDLLTDYFNGNVPARILTMTKVVGIYLAWLFFPFNIHATILDVSIVIHSFLNIPFLGSLFVLLMIFVYTIKIRPSSGVIFFAILWFFITLLPVLNILLMPNIFAARFLYVPSVGFSLFLAVVWGKFRERNLQRPWRHLSPRLADIALSGLLLLYAVLSYLSCYAWENDLIFHAGILEFYPQNPVAHAAAGDVFRKYGLLDQAQTELHQAIALNPYYSEAHNNLGLVYLEQEKTGQAIEEFQKAINIDPGYTTAKLNLCGAWGADKRYKDSIACFENFIKNNPDDSRAFYNLGISYLRMNDHAKASAVWAKALTVKMRGKNH